MMIRVTTTATRKSSSSSSSSSSPHYYYVRCLNFVLGHCNNEAAQPRRSIHHRRAAVASTDALLLLRPTTTLLWNHHHRQRRFIHNNNNNNNNNNNILLYYEQQKPQQPKRRMTTTTTGTTMQRRRSFATTTTTASASTTAASASTTTGGRCKTNHDALSSSSAAAASSLQQLPPSPSHSSFDIDDIDTEPCWTLHDFRSAASSLVKMLKQQHQPQHHKESTIHQALSLLEQIVHQVITLQQQQQQQQQQRVQAKGQAKFLYELLHWLCGNDLRNVIHPLVTMYHYQQNHHHQRTTTGTTTEPFYILYKLHSLSHQLISTFATTTTTNATTTESTTTSSSFIHHKSHHHDNKKMKNNVHNFQPKDLILYDIGTIGIVLQTALLSLSSKQQQQQQQHSSLHNSSISSSSSSSSPSLSFLTDWKLNPATMVSTTTTSTTSAPPPSASVAQIAQDTLEFATYHAELWQAPQLRPDLHMYSQVIQAWIQSQSPCTPQRIQWLLHDMKVRYNLVPNAVIYTTLLRYWSSRGSIGQMERILDEMATHGIEPTLTCLAQILHGYAKSGQLQMAEGIFDLILSNYNRQQQKQVDAEQQQQTLPAEQKPTSSRRHRIRDHNGSSATTRNDASFSDVRHRDREMEMIVSSAQTILNGYRQYMTVGIPRHHDYYNNDDDNNNDDDSSTQEIILDRAEQLVDKVMFQSMTIPESSREKMLGTLMDIYAHAGSSDKAESIFQSMLDRQPNIVFYGLLIKAYGNADQADKASQTWDDMLNDSRIIPNIKVFTTLLQAWTESTRSDAMDRAWEMIEEMGHNSQYIQWGIRPDTFTFNVYLKGLTKSKWMQTTSAEERCLRAEYVLDEMERRYNDNTTASDGTSNVRANLVSYNLALKLCLQQAGDLDRADAIVRRLEERLIPPPDIAIYTDILNQYADVGTITAAERAEQILCRIIDRSSNPTTNGLQPNTFLFGAAILAWTKADSVDSPQSVWRIFQLMLDHNVEPNMSIYTNMITCLSKSTEQIHVSQAEELLRTMEETSATSHNNDTAGECRDAEDDAAVAVAQQRQRRYAEVVQPDRRHYGPVMNGWMGIGDAQRAAQVLFRRIDAYRHRNVTAAVPSPDLYYLVSNAYIRSNDLVGATKFLDEIQRLHHDGHIPDGPDLYTYVTLHSAWLRVPSSNESDPYRAKLEAQISALRRTTVDPHIITTGSY